MCIYYENGSDKIKQGDRAKYLAREIEILESKHIKETKSMKIVYISNDREICIEVPYHTVMDAMNLISRAEVCSDKSKNSSAYGSNPVKESGIRINEMGSEVVEGYTCKPKDYDANRPIMHYKTLLMICDDERCGKAGKIDKASYLRDILKDMDLNKGENRIKISRTSCYGACRFRQVCQVTENTQANGNAQNNAIWLKNTHRYSDDEWRDIFKKLSNDIVLTQELSQEHFIPMKVYN